MATFKFNFVVSGIEEDEARTIMEVIRARLDFINNMALTNSGRYVPDGPPEALLGGGYELIPDGAAVLVED